MQAIRLATTTAAAVLASLFAQGAWASCYVVYSADKQVIYRSQVPPVDLSRNLHETVPAIAPGGALVFSLDNYGCDSEVNLLPTSVATRARAGAAGATGAPLRQRAPRADRG